VIAKDIHCPLITSWKVVSDILALDLVVEFYCRHYYKTVSKEETISHAFINLMGNIQEYNMGKI